MKNFRTKPCPLCCTRLQGLFENFLKTVVISIAFFMPLSLQVHLPRAVHCKAPVSGRMSVLESRKSMVVSTDGKARGGHTPIRFSKGSERREEWRIRASHRNPCFSSWRRRAGAMVVLVVVWTFLNPRAGSVFQADQRQIAPCTTCTCPTEKYMLRKEATTNQMINEGLNIAWAGTF